MGLQIRRLEQQKETHARQARQVIHHKTRSSHWVKQSFLYDDYLAVAVVRIVSRLGYVIILLMSICPLIVLSTVTHSNPIHAPLVHLEEVHFLVIQAGSPPTSFLAVSFTTVICLGLALKAATECAH